MKPGSNNWCSRCGSGPGICTPCYYNAPPWPEEVIVGGVVVMTMPVHAPFDFAAHLAAPTLAVRP